MFKELMHIFRTYFISFRYNTKSSVNIFKNIVFAIVIYYLITVIL